MSRLPASFLGTFPEEHLEIQVLVTRSLRVPVLLVFSLLELVVWLLVSFVLLGAQRRQKARKVLSLRARLRLSPASSR
jgi:hypothetical protein